MQNPTFAAGIDDLAHDHVFDHAFDPMSDHGGRAAERGTHIVLWITAAMMALEIAAGWWSNSMALLADGWHMSSHAIAIGLSAFAYAAARRYARDPRFAFGTWKIEILAGYTSAVFLLGIAGLMAFGSVERLLHPAPIGYREAILIAVAGLAVNVVCGLVLGHAHRSHDHDHDHDDHRDHGHHDLNLKSAYVHVMADAATSVLAIAALAGGWAFGWPWLDPAIGLVGAVVVAAWAKNLIGETGKILLDREMDAGVVDEIREVVAAAADTRLVDLHVWRVGGRVFACALRVVTPDPLLTPAALRARLTIHAEIVHATIEVHHRPALADGSVLYGRGFS